MQETKLALFMYNENLRIWINSSNEEVRLELKNQLEQMRSRLLHVIRARLDLLELTEAWVSRSEDQIDADRGNISPDKLYVSLKNVKDTQAVEYMLTTVGRFEMWETYLNNGNASFGYIDDNEMMATPDELKQYSALQQVCVFNENAVRTNVFAFVEDEEAAAEVFDIIKSTVVLPPDLEFMYGRPSEDGLTPVYTVKMSSGGSPLDGGSISDAKAERYIANYDPYSGFYSMEGQSDSQLDHRYKVSLTFNPAGAKIFAILTRNNIGMHLAVSIDKRIYMYPVVHNEIESGKIDLVSTGLTEAEAENLVVILRSGPLPAKVTLEYK